MVYFPESLLIPNSYGQGKQPSFKESCWQRILGEEMVPRLLKFSRSEMELTCQKKSNLCQVFLCVFCSRLLVNTSCLLSYIH